VTGAVPEICLDTVQVASRTVADLVSTDSDWTSVRLFGSNAVIAYTADRREHERRAAHGMGALLSSDHLELLMSLPLGWQVPVPSLSHRDQRRLRRITPGALRAAAGTVERLAVSPVRVSLAIVRAASWQSGLERAGRFAPFTARIMWLPRLPGDIEMLARQAERFGVGVLVGSAKEAEAVLPPPRFVRRRFTVAGWLFTEQVYERLRSPAQRDSESTSPDAQASWTA
jgi:hypothetical protein